MKLKSCFWALLLLVLIAGLPLVAVARQKHKPGSESAKTASRLYTVRLRPGPANKDGVLGYVDVSATLQDINTQAGVPVLKMPLVIANVDSVAKTMQNFTASDAKGPVVLQPRDDTGTTQLPYRRWAPARPIVGDLSLRYRAPISLAIPKRTGPPFALRTEGGGFSGAGAIFLVAPAAETPYRLALRWDLSELGPKTAGVSSFGDGDMDIAQPEEAARGLESGFFMAGPLHRYPGKSSPRGFSSAWLDSPFLAFDPEPVMAWSESLYRWDKRFFASGDRPYRVFLRYNPVNPGGGVELMNSFVATYDRNTRVDDLKFTLAHEMVHTFAPSLGKEGLATSWFSEGLAVLYQRYLPLEAGLTTPGAFLKDLNETAARYYTNPLNNVPNDQIGPRFWEDTRIRVLPYDRGSMYMAIVDSRIRKASGGKKSLHDLVLTLLDRQKRGLPDTPAVWVDLITSELGPSAKEEYESMLQGALMLPDSDAFGPCFARTTAPLRRFELGFDPGIMGTTRVIRDLIPGSAAARAGIQDGDEIVAPVGLDSVQGDQSRTLTLQIRRNGKVFPVTYLPRGETIETYQWTRVPSVPDKDCRY